jgi:hypothetical protein
MTDGRENLGGAEDGSILCKPVTVKIVVGDLVRPPQRSGSKLAGLETAIPGAVEAGLWKGVERQKQLGSMLAAVARRQFAKSAARQVNRFIVAFLPLVRRPAAAAFVCL